MRKRGLDQEITVTELSVSESEMETEVWMFRRLKAGELVAGDHDIKSITIDINSTSDLNQFDVDRVRMPLGSVDRQPKDMGR